MITEENQNHKQDRQWRIVKDLAELPSGAIIGVEALAQMFNRCSKSIERAVERGEFPQPIRILGKRCWTAGVIQEHITNRLKSAQQKAKKEGERIALLSP